MSHLHAGLDPTNPGFTGDLGGYSYSAFGKLLSPSDPGGVQPPNSSNTSPFQWQAKRLIAPNLYDSRARVWSADLGVFLQPDEYVFLSHGGTLWSWPGQNPFRWRDPSGRGPAEDLAGTVLDALVSAAGSGTVVAGEQVASETPLGAASDAALNSLELFAAQVKGLAQDMFAEQDADANAIAQAAARENPAVEGPAAQSAGPDCDKGSKIDRKAFRAQRENFWKAEAQNNPAAYSQDNLQRMLDGKAPIGPDGYPMELHHVDGTPDADLQPMTRSDHRLGKNYLANHPWLGGD
jgi:RHS repeat-associated protein